jgi:hypothetical protein
MLLNRTFTLLFLSFVLHNVSAQIGLTREYSDSLYRSYTHFGQMENVTPNSSATYNFLLLNESLRIEEISCIRFFDGLLERNYKSAGSWKRVVRHRQLGFILARGNKSLGIRGGEQIRGVFSTSGWQPTEYPSPENVEWGTARTFRIDWQKKSIQ